MNSKTVLKDGEGANKRGGADYRLDDHVGFILRQVFQRHASIFADQMTVDLTPTQFAVIAKLAETGALGQNELGRKTAMDAATIKGVVDRLREKGFVQAATDIGDRRRRVISLTPVGCQAVDKAVPAAFIITEATLAALDNEEQRQFLKYLARLV